MFQFLFTCKIKIKLQQNRFVCFISVLQTAEYNGDGFDSLATGETISWDRGDIEGKAKILL